VISLLLPSSSYGQAVSTGTVSGTIVDPTGAAVIDATVALIDPATNSTRTTPTNDTGRYFFANVTPAAYNLTVTKPGFRTAKLTNQVVNVSTTLTLNITMELGSVNQTVEVSATNSDLQTMNATVGNTVSGDLLQNMPSINRDATTFVTLQPGVS